MAMPKAAGWAAEVLADPDAVISEAVRRAEPDLPESTCAGALTEVASSLATRRRIAQALFDDPELLTSGAPQGSPALDRLIAALQRRGSSRVVLPRCGRCDRQRRLTSRDGSIRVCGSCDGRRRKTNQRCSVCGQQRHTESTTWDGNPVCATCDRLAHNVDHLEHLVVHIRQISPAAEPNDVRRAVRSVLPSTRSQRRVADELSAHPQRLTGEAAHATAPTWSLLGAVVEAGISGFAIPQCPFCNRTVALTKVREEVRCCRRCYERHRKEVCVGCGADRPVTSRSLGGEPMCQVCHNRQPVNQEICPDCGDRARLHRVSEHKRCCRRCQRAPIAVCALCQRPRPCYFADTDSPRCEPCSNRLLRREPCSRCGKTRIVGARTAGGEPLCNRCGRVKARCRDCNRNMLVRAWHDDGPRCTTCHRKHPASLKPCRQCGTVELLYRAELCAGCACLQLLHAVLGDDDGVFARLRPVFDALARSTPEPTLLYLERGGGVPLLEALRESGQPITHDLLDAFSARPPTRALRDALVCAGALEPRDEILLALDRRLQAVLAEVGDNDDRHLLRGFVTWRLLRRLRTQSASRPITKSQAVYAHRKLLIAIDLIEFAHQHDRRLDEVDQHLVDRWQERQPQAALCRDFLSWASAQRRCRSGLHATPKPHTRSSLRLRDDERFELSRRLLHDDNIDRGDRFAGLLILLFAQPASRIVRLRTDAITQRVDNQAVYLSLGSEPARLPAPLDQLALDLVVNRHRGRAALARVTDHDWLFPGVRAGTPMTSGHLNGRLKGLGVPPQAARQTTLMDLAGQLPAAVLSALLGIDVRTAQGWAIEAGHRSAYGAVVATRRVSERPAAEEMS